MQGDFSRLTFDATRHYSAVLLQQGRVQTDADWNEAALIQRHHLETTTTDVVGPSGAPRDHAGFGITPAGAQLTVGAGRYYVDGILCENDAAQTVGAVANMTAGRYALWLDVWHRHVSAVEDPAIRETALGGPDTATRLQVVWQLRMTRVANAGGSTSCDAVRPLWQAALTPSTGTMRAATRPPTATTSPCDIPAGAGYRGLENQLYRVEVHEPGTETTARFKWSRENGSVEAAVDGVSGVEVTLRGLRTDDPLGFAQGDWVELVDDAMELAGGRGALFQIAQLFPERRVVRLNATPSTPVDPARHPRLRRWDQRTGATASGVSMVPAGGATAVPLERGIEVTFGAGRYNVGDYWVVAARTALGSEGGTIEWPAGQFRPPLGIVHHQALLAAVDFDGTSFAATGASDCRALFPPLTDIHATNVVYDAGQCDDLKDARTVQDALDTLCARRDDCCGVTVPPGPGWEAVFDKIPAGGSAHLCFLAADYPVRATITVRGKGTIHLSGAGAASRIIAAESECALLFADCQAVMVTDLALVSGTAGRTTPEAPALNGVLTCDNVGAVTIERVAAVCRPFIRRKSACLAVRCAPLASKTPQGATIFGPAAVRIRDCDLEAGYLQTGILVVNAGRATIEDNVVRVGAEVPAKAQIGRRITDRDLRATLSKFLVAGTVAKGVARVDPTRPIKGVVIGKEVGRKVRGVETAPRPDEKTAPRPLTPEELASGQIRVGGTAVGATGKSPTAPNAAGMPNVPGAPGAPNQPNAPGAPPAVTGATAAPATVQVAGGTVTVRAGQQEISFLTDPQVGAAWPALVAAVPPSDTTTAAALGKYVAQLADRVLFDPTFRDRFGALKGWFDRLRQDSLPAAAQGIVVGGVTAREVRIRGNTLTGVVEGIHIGLSHSESLRGLPDRAGTVLVADNAVDVVLPAATTRQRYGIYLGNCDSAVIENNRLAVRRTSVTSKMHIDGIHVYGALGRRIIVRQNHLGGFQTGALLTATLASPSANASKLWMIAETMAEGATTAVVAPAGVVQANNLK